MGNGPSAFGGMNWGGMNGMNGGNWNNEGSENNWGAATLREERGRGRKTGRLALRQTPRRGCPTGTTDATPTKTAKFRSTNGAKQQIDRSSSKWTSTATVLSLPTNICGFARLKNIEVKVAAYEEGLREPGNWNLGGEKPSGNDRSRGFGPGGGGPGQGFGPGSGFNRGGDNRGGDNRGGDNRGNFNKEGNKESSKAQQQQQRKKAGPKWK